MPLTPSPGNPKMVSTPHPIRRSTNKSATVVAISTPLAWTCVAASVPSTSLALCADEEPHVGRGGEMLRNQRRAVRPSIATACSTAESISNLADDVRQTEETAPVHESLCPPSAVGSPLQLGG